jgi:hypothetical protein
MKFPNSDKIVVIDESTGDLTNQAKKAIWDLTDKQLEITIRAKVRYVGSRVLTIEATNAYDVTDVLGVRVSDIVKMEVVHDE